MQKKIPSLLSRIKKGAKDIKAWQAGKLKFKTTEVSEDGTHKIRMETGPEVAARRRQRVARWKRREAKRSKKQIKELKTLEARDVLDKGLTSFQGYLETLGFQYRIDVMWERDGTHSRDVAYSMPRKDRVSFILEYAKARGQGELVDKAIDKVKAARTKRTYKKAGKRRK